jgi:MYXO-CTERM domain-containing protein
MRCTRFKRVRVKGRGIQKRCAKFSKGRAKTASRSRGYKRRPSRKGRKCKAFGVNKRGRVTCRSYKRSERQLARSPKRAASSRSSGVMPFSPSAPSAKTGSGWLKLVGLGGLPSRRRRKRR